MTAPCTYCGRLPCPTPTECAAAAEKLARQDAGMRRHYLSGLPVKKSTEEATNAA